MSPTKAASEKAPKKATRRAWKKEATAALNFWQALEYLAPQSPPRAIAKDCVWELKSDSEMPWADARKHKLLDLKYGPSRRFQLFAGIIPGPELVETARRLLGAEPIDATERMPPSPAASLVIGIDGKGMSTGRVFVSTVPWAMAKIAVAAGEGAEDPKVTEINFRGFFGAGGVQEKLDAAIKDLLVERKLVDPQSIADDVGPTDDAKSPNPPGSQSPGARGKAADPDAGQVPQDPAKPPELRKVTLDDVKALTELVYTHCGWRPEKEEPVRIQSFRASKNDQRAQELEGDPLNSFYAEDIERVDEAFARGDIGVGLECYLKGEDSKERVDLKSEIQALISGVHPALLPPGCWPARQGLVTAQQFAVNEIAATLAPQGGLFAVNGPPGTGKTTMLRDIVASIVVARADKLAAYERPLDAFKGSIDIENYQWTAYALADELRDFGIVVASANNAAVENVTRELPALESVDPALDIDYFSVVSETIAVEEPEDRRGPEVRRPQKPKTWGLTAAVLGSKGKRSQFAGRFWLAGMNKPKAEGADGKGRPLEPPHPLRLRSLQDILGSGEHDAKRWGEARKAYVEAAERVHLLKARAGEAVEAVRERAQLLRRREDLRDGRAPALARRLELDSLARDAGIAAREARVEADAASAKVAALQDIHRAELNVGTKAAQREKRVAEMPAGGLSGAEEAVAAAKVVVETIAAERQAHMAVPPTAMGDLLKTAYSRNWHAREKSLDKESRAARSALTRALTAQLATQESVRELEKLDGQVAKALQALEMAKAAAGALDILAGADIETLRADKRAKERRADETSQSQELLQAELDRIKREIAGGQAAIARIQMRLGEIDALLKECGIGPPQESLFDLESLSEADLHRATPYAMRELFEARRELFVAALELHKSFIAASWSKLARTLSAFVNLLQGNISAGQVDGGVMQLWDAFFLVVPVVSTTFASLPRLFAGVGKEQLAWLLIDEAGQAAPQHALGGIWRARRSVIVGDPLQLEPITAVPKELLRPLLRRCGAEPHWVPPEASAQVLADRANKFGMSLPAREGDGKLWLGCPLRVHRRCLDPMFSIANKIAYDGSMVYGTGPDTGSPGIGPSQWIDMPASDAEGHWVPSQGQRALDIIDELTGGQLKDGSRFKAYVITPFRTVAMEMRERLYQRYGDASRGMVGTVHTFQGKEAEFVVFLLGGDPQSPGVINRFAGAKPNLINVALTRAKRRIYVIGSRRFWTGANDGIGHYRDLARGLDGEPPGR